MSFTMLQKAEYRRLIDRVWAPFLSSAESRVVAFIFTTTIEWGKPYDRLKAVHFVYGVGGAMGTGLSDKTVRRALDTLADDRAIVRVRTPYGYAIGLNLDWKPEMLRIPKHNRDRQTGILPCPRKGVIGQNDLSRSVKMTDVIREEHTFEDHTLSPSAGASDEPATGSSVMAVRAAIDLATAKAKKAKEDARKAKAAAGKAPNLFPVWSKAFQEAFPGFPVPAWTRREQGQAGLFLRAGNKVADPSEVFEWCITSWRLIMSSRFHWMKDAPELPAVGFMLRFKEHFYDAWNARERLRQEMTLNGRDRAVRKLVHGGMTRIEAEQEVAQREQGSKDHLKYIEDRKRLDEMLRKAEQRETVPAPSRLMRAPKVRSAPQRPVDDAEEFGGFSGVSYDD